MSASTSEPSAEILRFVEAAETFRGLWYSRVSGETRWTCTLLVNGDIVETPYYFTPWEAVDAARRGVISWGQENTGTGATHK